MQFKICHLKVGGFPYLDNIGGVFKYNLMTKIIVPYPMFFGRNPFPDTLIRLKVYLIDWRLQFWIIIKGKVGSWFSQIYFKAFLDFLGPLGKKLWVFNEPIFFKD